MRIFPLTGWQRIGILLSIIWIFIGGTLGWKHAYDKVDADFKLCVAAVKTAADLEACRNTHNTALKRPKAVSASVVAFGPLIVVWLICYGFVLLFRWIRRGFRASRSD
jgi:hypothetical protein